MNSNVETAVLIPVYRDEAGVVRVVLIRRAEGGIHGGQLAFPGGKMEAGDATLLDTAVRETEEEIGLPHDQLTILAEIERFDTLTTGFVITPYLARIERPGQWAPDPHEVAEVLEPTLGELTDPAAQGTEMRRFDAHPQPIRINFTRVRGYQLWGATYRILQPLLPRLADGEWPI